MTTSKELEQEINEKRKELASTRLSVRLGTEKRVHRLKQLRRSLARLLTKRHAPNV